MLIPKEYEGKDPSTILVSIKCGGCGKIWKSTLDAVYCFFCGSRELSVLERTDFVTFYNKETHQYDRLLPSRKYKKLAKDGKTMLYCVEGIGKGGKKLSSCVPQEIWNTILQHSKVITKVSSGMKSAILKLRG